jgi:hypothetical protein
MALRPEHVVIGLLLLWSIHHEPKQPTKGHTTRGPSEPWSDEDMLIFAGHVKAAGVPVETALLVYTEESNLDPHASSGSAWGLAQITTPTLKDIGWTESGAAFGKLGVADQAPWIQKLLEYQSKAIGFVPVSPLDLFAANLSPAAARARSDKIYDSAVPAQAAAYNANRGLDRTKKGYIARSDLSAVLNDLASSVTYTKALAQLQRMQHA